MKIKIYFFGRGANQDFGEIMRVYHSVLLIRIHLDPLILGYLDPDHSYSSKCFVKTCIIRSILYVYFLLLGTRCIYLPIRELFSSNMMFKKNVLVNNRWETGRTRIRIRICKIQTRIQGSGVQKSFGSWNTGTITKTCLDPRGVLKWVRSYGQCPQISCLFRSQLKQKNS